MVILATHENVNPSLLEFKCIFVEFERVKNVSLTKMSWKETGEIEKGEYIKKKNKTKAKMHNASSFHLDIKLLWPIK